MYHRENTHMHDFSCSGAESVVSLSYFSPAQPAGPTILAQRYPHFLRRSGAPMTQTSTLCSHRSISHCSGELWSMPCIISWAPVLQAVFHSPPLPPLLAVICFRRESPAARKNCTARTTVVLWSQRCAPRLPRTDLHGSRFR